MVNAWCTALAYDEEAQYVFIGDYSGAITVCKLEQNGVKFINTLKVNIVEGIPDHALLYFYFTRIMAQPICLSL